MTNTTMHSNGPSASSAHSPDSLDFTGILDALLVDEGPAPSSRSAAPEPERAWPGQRAITRAPHTETEVPQVETIRSDIHRLASPALLQRLRDKIVGDPLKRQQLATLGRRIDALNVVEEGKLVLLLIGASRLAGFRVVVDTVGEEERILACFEQGTWAFFVGKQMVERDANYMSHLSDRVIERVEAKALDAVDLSPR